MDPDLNNLSAVLINKGNLILEHKPVRSLGPKDVLVAVDSVGICGSDVHYWHRGAIGNFILKAPMVLGHETSGRIIRCGSAANKLSPGDRVALEPGVPCRSCDFCKRGSYNLCPDIAFCATPPYDGTLARYFVHPEDMCFKLPENVSFEEGAFVEPLSVAVQACKKSGVSFGHTVFICGAGPIGLLTLLVCKAAGVAKVCIADVDTNRLKIAEAQGADVTYLVQDKFNSLDNANSIIKALNGQRVDVSIECSGAEPSLETCVYVTKPGGVVQAIGMGHETVKVPITDVIVRDIRIQGSFRYANCYPIALTLISSGKVDVKPLITHRFSLEQTVAAFETAKNPQSGSIKVMIKCSK